MSELKNIMQWHEASAPKDKTEEERELLYIGLIQEEFLELMTAKTRGNTLKEAGDLIVVATGLIHALGADVEDVLQKINNSNFSKFTYEDELKDVMRRFREKGEVVYSYYHESMGVYSIHRTRDGKMMKTEFYTPVDEDSL